MQNLMAKFLINAVFITKSADTGSTDRDPFPHKEILEDQKPACPTLNCLLTADVLHSALPKSVSLDCL